LIGAWRRDRSTVEWQVITLGDRECRERVEAAVHQVVVFLLVRGHVYDRRRVRGGHHVQVVVICAVLANEGRELLVEDGLWLLDDQRLLSG
jgi:hypothetical protein